MVALDIKGHQAVNPRRLNPTPGSIRILVADNPFHTLPDGDLATGQDPKILIGVQEFVRGKKERLPHTAPGRQVVVHILTALGKQFVQTTVRRQGTDHVSGGQNGQGQNRRPRPGGKIIDVERKPFGEEYHLRRQVGRFLPRPLADQRKPVAGKHPYRTQTPVGKDPFPSFTQALVIRGKAICAQSRITFDRGINVPIRSVVINFPRAVLALDVEQGLHDLLLVRVRIAQEVQG